MIDESITSEAVGLLKSLISIPSLSREEEKAADYLQNYIEAVCEREERPGPILTEGNTIKA